MFRHPSLGHQGLALSLLVFFYWPIFRLPPPVTGATSEDVFDGDTLHDVHLYMHSRDLQRLRSEYLENTYFPADLVWRQTRVRNVAVRSRGGLATRDPVKLSFRVDVNRYHPGQTFLGLRAIVLDNLFQDRTMMHEALAMSVHARMGQTALRESFCRVYVNREYQGLYAIVEDVDESFLTRTLGRDGGYLFEYQWQQPFHGGPLGADFGIYRTLFEAKTHERAPDDELYVPIRKLFDTASLPEDVATREDLERYVDLEQLVTALALDTLLGEEDGLAGLHGMNNFYLYRDAESTRHSFIPWDRDRAFNLIDSSIFDRVHENALTRRALSYGDLFDRYLRTLEDGARMLASGGWLSAEIERLRALIGPAAYADSRKPYSNEDFEAAVQFLRDFATERPARVIEEVAAYRATAGVGKTR
jgi:spore coat protein CotH